MQLPTIQEVGFITVLITSTTVLLISVVHFISPKERSESEKLAFDLGTLFVRFFGLILSAALAYFLISDNLFALGIGIIVSYLLVLLIKAKI